MDAAGARMGTCFVATLECDADELAGGQKLTFILTFGDS